MTAPPTAPWTWKRRDGGPTHFELTEAHLAAVRELVVWWDDTEAGAPALAHPDLVSLGSPPRTELEMAAAVFMDAAAIDTWPGPVHSPWGDVPAEDADDLLSALPDGPLHTRWRRGGHLHVAPSPAARALWAAAARGPAGIDPKRPFGTATVMRDLRAILDPQGQLDAAALATLGDQARAELLPMLQRFVQHATLPLGPYSRVDGAWVPGRPPAEELDAMDWWHRLCGEAATMNAGYSATIRALHHLVDEGRVEGDYPELVERYRLHDLYGAPAGLRWTGGWTARLEAAVAAFPEQRVFRLQLVRQANARAEFPTARVHLEAMDRWAPPLPGPTLATPGWPAVLLLEGLACRRGLGLLDRQAFLDALTDRGHDPDATPWDVVFRVLHHGRDVVDDPVLWRHAEAVSAQLQLQLAAAPGER